MKYKNLIVDLDNTLYSYEIPHKRAMTATLKLFVQKFDVDQKVAEDSFKLGRFKTHIELSGSASSHNRLLYFQKALEINNLNTVKNALQLYNCYWDTFLDEMKLYDSVIEYFSLYRTGGAKVCILTDLTADIQYRKIEKLGLCDSIDFLVTSEEVGVEKPHPNMFYKALQKLNCGAKDTIMIGDSWDKDIVGASNLGIFSIWINHKEESAQITPLTKQVNHFDEIIRNEL